jgi:hypothetical protein
MKTARGNTQLQRHLDGKKLTRSQAVNAKCSDCMCNFEDGLVSCEIPSCPLFPFMVYRKKSPRTPKIDQIPDEQG